MAKNIGIIGGGHNGLVCACYLAGAGHKVTVLERRDIIGGAAVTEEFHPGYRNSVASYTVSLLHPRVIADLNLATHGLKIVARRINNFLPLADGNSLVSYPDEAQFMAEIARHSGKDVQAMKTYQARLQGVVPVIKDLMLMTPPRLEDSGFADLMPLMKLSRNFGRLDGAQRRFLLKLFSVSAGELLDDEFESEAVKALLGFDSIVGHYASPYTPGSAYVLLHHVVGEINGKSGLWGHAIGGMGSITEAIGIEAQRRGVKIATSQAVANVDVQAGRATGITLIDGTNLKFDLVVANVNPKMLYLNMLDAASISTQTLEHFDRYKNESGTFRMNVALSELPQFTHRHVEGYLEAGIIMAPDLDYMDEAYSDARKHGWSRQPIVEMLIPSIIDDSLAPPGKHVASLFCQQFDPSLKSDWDEHRLQAAQSIIETVTGFAPNFKASVIASQIHSPWDLETKFGLIGGDIFHGRLSLDQLFSARPMLGAGQYQTEIKNLYLCGAGTHPGGGVSGIPGHNAAREIIKRL